MCPPISPAEASLDYPDHEKDQMIALDTLAAYFVQLARSEKEKSKRREFFTKVRCVSMCGVCKACMCSVYVCVSVSACVRYRSACMSLCCTHCRIHMHTTCTHGGALTLCMSLCVCVLHVL